MGQVSRQLKETITHWANTGSDGFGGFTFSTPVTMLARWEDRNESFETIQGREEISNAIVYTAVDVQIEDYLARGDQTDVSHPRDAIAAFKVRRFDRQTSLRNLETIRKVIL